jgi:hypothetical protein
MTWGQSTGRGIACLSRRSSAFGPLFFLTLTLSTPSVLLAQNNDPWTAVASTGTVDEADLDIVQFGYCNSGLGSLICNTNTAVVKSTAPLPANVHIRYNVVSVDGLLDKTDVRLKARLRDNGANARVLLVLKSVNFSTGAIATLRTLDSDSFAAASGFVFRSTGLAVCNQTISFNFDQNAYYIDVTITKSGADGNPGLAAIQLAADTCIPL